MIITNHTNINPIHSFTIYGERHSGTKFLKKVIEQTFDIPITWNFGWKHFFGHYNEQIKKDGANTLFLCIVRDPYDWIMAMFKKPYHVPYYIRKNLESFLTSEWMSVNAKGKEKTDHLGNYEDRNFLTNNRFSNIFELRSIKTRYLLDTLPLLCQNYCFITYEYLISNVELFKIKLQENFDLSKKKQKIFQPHNNSYYVDEKILKIINNNIDWDIENRIKYYVKNSI